MCVDRIPVSISYAFTTVYTRQSSHLQNILAVFLCKGSGRTSQRTLCFQCSVESTSLRVEIQKFVSLRDDILPGKTGSD